MARTVLSFNRDWKFSKTAEIPSVLPADWEDVALPHTWNAVDGQDGGNDYWRGTACYVKCFAKPENITGKRVFISFKGAAMTATVYVNGTRVAYHEGGYSAFRADITDVLQDDNIICVTVDNGINDHVYPQKADFTFYGGIYREVELIITEENHFELVKNGSNGLKVTPVIEGSDARIELEAFACGGDKVVFAVTDEAAGVLEATAPVADGIAKAVISVQNVHLWNGVKDPYLYTAEAKLAVNDEVVDTVSARFGCRTIECSPEKGFLLNGEVYPLRGVSRHQDYAGLGNAITIEQHKEDIQLIREIGANTIRLAHYQHAQEFYDLCDEYGIVVWAEIPYITQHMPNGRQNTLDQMTDLITQCYNHPSIVCWGLSNEITASGSADEDLMENHRLLNDLCHKMDKTRPTTMAHVFMLETDSPLISIADIGSYNLYYGWYVGELEENDTFFDEYHKNHPDRVIGFSEYGADTNPGLHSDTPDKGDYTEEYQCVYHEHILKCIEARPYLWATHVWNMFDFAADGRDEGGEHGKNQKGLVTIDRKIKKDAFYLYKAYWNKADAFVHICGRRFVDRVGEETKVKIYTNCKKISLYVNGELFETGECDKIAEFTVALTGDLTLKAVAEDAAVSDEISIRKVSEANPAYRLVKETGNVTNWFDAEGVKEGYFSINDKFGDLMANPGTGAIVGKLMQKMIASRGDVAKSTSDNKVLQKMLNGMTFASLLKQAGDAVSNDQIRELNAALQKFPKAPAKVKLEFGLESHLSEIFAHEETKAIFDKTLPGIRQMVESQPSTMGFTLSKIVAFSQGRIPEAAVNALADALSKVEIYADPEEMKPKYSEETPITKECTEIVKEDLKTSIRPGAVMRDTEGKRIQAHAGQVFTEDGVYYWIGENKDRTDGENDIWTWGIRAYRSTDLYNWEDLGLIMKPNFTDKKSGLYPESHTDRPHILKNPKTGKYVCWVKQSSDEACFFIATADKITGPYEIVKENYRPEGLKVGDFDMIESEDGKAYMFMVSDQEGVFGFTLSEDYCSVSGIISKQYDTLYAPFCREGVTLIEHEGKKYMLTSGMSGYLPNKSEYGFVEDWNTPFETMGNPHVNDDTNASFNSQISQIFKVPGKDLYVAIADRWVPGFPMDGKMTDIITRVIASHSDPEKYQATEEEKRIMMSAPMLESNNSSISDYIWLPVIFNGDKMEIKWYDEWRVEDF